MSSDFSEDRKIFCGRTRFFLEAPLTLTLFPVGPPRRTVQGGRPQHEPTDHTRLLVAVLKAQGDSHDTIAMQLRITRTTLSRYYKAELRHGFELVKSRVQASLTSKALEGSLPAMLAWLHRFCPEWRVVKEDSAAQADADAAARAAHNEGDDEVVHFYLPPNHRDEPLEQTEETGPIIDGEVAA